jgi:hypothetical protein
VPKLQSHPLQSLLILTSSEVSQAWEFLSQVEDLDPSLVSPPPNLQHLTWLEWRMLHQLLHWEMFLRDNSPLQ